MSSNVKLHWSRIDVSEDKEWINDYLWENYSYFNSLSKKLGGSNPFPELPEDNELVLIVFAYNNSYSINIQRKLIRKYIGSEIPILYVDDSTNIYI